MAAECLVEGAGLGSRIERMHVLWLGSGRICQRVWPTCLPLSGTGTALSREFAQCVACMTAHYVAVSAGCHDLEVVG